MHLLAFAAPAGWLVRRRVSSRLHQQRQLAVRRAVAAQHVQRPPPRRGGEPGARVTGDAPLSPGVEGGDERVLGALLGDIEIAHQAHRRGKYEGPLATVRLGKRLANLAHASGAPPRGVHDGPELDPAARGGTELGEGECLVEAGEYDAVIFWMEDRSARDVVAAGEFVQACRKAGVNNVVLPSYHYDLTDPEDASRFYGEVLAAEREMAKLSKRVRRARLQEAELGWPHAGGRRSFGEPGGRRVRDLDKDDDDPDKWLRDEQGRWVWGGGVPAEQVENERELIREAARRILAGDSLRGIVLDWNGCPDKNGKPTKPVRSTAADGERWRTQSLRRMLLQPRLAGLRAHNGKLYESREIEPILDRETWEAVRTVLTDPSRKREAAGGVYRYLLAGFVFCGVCGSRARGMLADGQRVYVCLPPSEAAGAACNGRPRAVPRAGAALTNAYSRLAANRTRRYPMPVTAAPRMTRNTPEISTDPILKNASSVVGIASAIPAHTPSTPITTMNAATTITRSPRPFDIDPPDGDG